MSLPVVVSKIVCFGHALYIWHFDNFITFYVLNSKLIFLEAIASSKKKKKKKGIDGRIIKVDNYFVRKFCDM